MSIFFIRPCHDLINTAYPEIMLNIFIMSLPFYFNNNPITYTDFLVFRTNKMIRLAVDIDFSRNTSSEPYNSYLKLSCFNINSNTISFTLLLVYQLIKSKNTTKKYYIHFIKCNYLKNNIT